MTTNDEARQFVPILRFKLDRKRMALWKVRLGKSGTEALSRLLTSEELPFEILRIQFERAYKIRKRVLKGTSAANLDEIVAERSFKLPGVSHFVTILVRPFPSVEEVMEALTSFTCSIEKRYAHMRSAHVVESENGLPTLANTRIVEVYGENSSGIFVATSIASVVGTDIVIVEFRSTPSNPWVLSDCENVVHLQIRKIQDK
jgi:hypothetical protein